MITYGVYEQKVQDPYVLMFVHSAWASLCFNVHAQSVVTMGTTSLRMPSLWFCFLRESGWDGLVDELQMEVDRICTRNLGRDDRSVGNHNKLG